MTTINNNNNVAGAVALYRLQFVLAIVVVVFSFGPGSAWIECSDEQGGGKCPDRATCCPLKTASSEDTVVSGCISSKNQDPDGMGVCCDDDRTGCGYGYQCAVNNSNWNSIANANVNYNVEEFCQLLDPHPEYLTNDTPRYQLCHVPNDLQTVYGLPFPGREGKTFDLVYYSNMGNVQKPTNDHLQVQTVLIMIHGSERNADDYLCAALSLMQNRTVLVVVPQFASPEDLPKMNVTFENPLVWADQEDPNHPLSHSWRYGADALNANISSYQVLDTFLEYFVASSTIQYPNLRQISVAGHSAGAQVTHRWALLSRSQVWDLSFFHIRVIVANPRSYCYLDARRIGSDGKTLELPDTNKVDQCKGYNQWQWGLEKGGTVECPYRDRAMQGTTDERVAQRYATRRVIYLSGEYDIQDSNDRCETMLFQGTNRQQRAKNYIQALHEYFGRTNVHEFHIVPGSPHDHFLMFQSQVGRNAIFGDRHHKNHESSLSST